MATIHPLPVNPPVPAPDFAAGSRILTEMGVTLRSRGGAPKRSVVAK